MAEIDRENFLNVNKNKKQKNNSQWIVPVLTIYRAQSCNPKNGELHNQLAQLQTQK